MDASKLLDSLMKHEGLRLSAYRDSEGIWTIGYGHNLQVMEVDKELASQWLAEDMAAAYRTTADFDEYKFLDTDARRNVLIEMVFNMGPGRTRKFRKMLAAIRRLDFDEAAVEMLDSRWARQVGRRAGTLARMMTKGEFDV